MSQLRLDLLMMLLYFTLVKLLKVHRLYIFYIHILSYCFLFYRDSTQFKGTLCCFGEEKTNFNVYSIDDRKEIVYCLVPGLENMCVKCDLKVLIFFFFFTALQLKTCRSLQLFVIW